MRLTEFGEGHREVVLDLDGVAALVDHADADGRELAGGAHGREAGLLGPRNGDEHAARRLAEQLHEGVRALGEQQAAARLTGECGLDDREVLVDETQLAALRTELGAVLDRYRRRGAGTPGARRVTAVVALTPLPRRT